MQPKPDWTSTLSLGTKLQQMVQDVDATPADVIALAKQAIEERTPAGSVAKP